MRISKVLVAALPLALAGCSEFSGEDSARFHAPSSAPAVTASPEPAPAAHEGCCGCSDQSTSLSSDVAAQTAAVSCEPS